ncbi:MAG: NAD(P)H-hydrate dehydratase [Paracoccaceae bacterium]|nr:NAD(P)H-hydrate dehydratase [Paracoccaceae bacterium]
MTELLTSAQMRAVEAAAIVSGAASGLELMERAGGGVVEAILARWPELGRGPGRALVLCGPGNNGGDGFVVARLLAQRGWLVEVLLFGDAGRLPPDARANYLRWCEMGAVGVFARDCPAGMQTAGGVLVDALFGTGLTRALPSDLAAGLRALRQAPGGDGWRRVAVDVVSGLCADSGRVLHPEGGATQVPGADLTVTFHRQKLGHHLAEGAGLSGQVVVFDIGLAGAAAPVGGTVLNDLNGAVDSGALQKASGAGRHKYSHGHALILSGPPGHGGAGRLAARGALRIGAGVVTLGCAPDALAENAARLDAVMLREVAGAEDLARVLTDARINALCVGPGLGISDDTGRLVAVALQSGRACVLDADALTLIARDAAVFARLHAGCVLTPHGGEFARLFPDIAARLAAPAVKGPAYSKVDACRAAAVRAGCVVLFKGADTVIAAPDGRCVVNSAQYDRAAPWLATAGAGDVLAGFIGGLMARGFDPMQAAQTAAWLHVEAARAVGPGLIAEDLPEALPGVFRAIGL